jgi:uncharacterized membrane protein
MRRFAWAAMTLLASLIAVYAALVLAGTAIAPPFVAALRRAVPFAVAAHLGGGIVALAIGPWQLNPRLRARAIRSHRWLGRAYVIAVLVGGTGALVLAPRSQEGPVTHVGFGVLALLWTVSTVQAYRHIRARQLESHRRWMIRSYSLTLAAVTLRIILPLEIAIGIPFHDAYQIVSWLCWVPNLVVAEWVVFRSARPPDAGHEERKAQAPYTTPNLRP